MEKNMEDDMETGLMGVSKVLLRGYSGLLLEN